MKNLLTNRPPASPGRSSARATSPRFQLNFDILQQDPRGIHVEGTTWNLGDLLDAARPLLASPTGQLSVPWMVKVPDGARSVRSAITRALSDLLAAGIHLDALEFSFSHRDAERLAPYLHEFWRDHGMEVAVRGTPRELLGLQRFPWISTWMVRTEDERSVRPQLARVAKASGIRIHERDVETLERAAAALWLGASSISGPILGGFTSTLPRMTVFQRTLMRVAYDRANRSSMLEDEPDDTYLDIGQLRSDAPIFA